MSAGILEHDKMAVGFIELYGLAWHNHEACQHLNGEVPLEVAEMIFDYTVAKRQLGFTNAEGIFVPVLGAHSLVREVEGGDDIILWPSVGERYECIQNNELLAWVQKSILDNYEVSIESVGTLLNGQKAFVNIILDEHTVTGDESNTVTRMMYSNSFGGNSYEACVHTTRVVCMNTLRMASAQGASNKTMAKFRHTANASQKIEAHLTDLANITAVIKEHHDIMDQMATVKVNYEQVNIFLDGLLPVPEKEGRGKTRSENKRAAILEIFDDNEHLKGKIQHTQYSLLQAVTDWTDHKSNVRNGDDEGGRFWDGIYGTKDRFKQKAVGLLIAA